MSPTKKRQPLTAEQQATVVQWRPLAIQYTAKAMTKRGLMHFMDEVEGIAHEALVLAVDVWVPSRGSFPSCLKWWVASCTNKFSAHGARTVQQSEHSAEYVDSWSLNRPVSSRGGHGGVVMTTWEELLVDENSVDPTETMDRRRLLRAAEVVLPRRVAANRDGEVARRNARLSVELWALRVLDGAPFEELGQPHGLSRQAVQQRVARVQEAFEAWARPIREEAA